ncbi:MAG: P-II family nitrogen regulator [Lachnotalea sp.]
MKKLEIIIKPEKLEDLKEILEQNKVKGLMITHIMGYGVQKGCVQKYRGNVVRTNLLPKIKVETIVGEDMAEKIITDVVREIKTGNYGDGKVFISNVEDAIRIRTGKRGLEAL